MTTTPFVPASDAVERARARALTVERGVLFVMGALTGAQVLSFAATALSFVCLLIAPAFLLMKHRALDMAPLVLAVLGWLSFLASCLINGASVLNSNALAPAAFALYFVGLTVLTGRSIESIAMVLGGLGVGAIVFFCAHGIELSNTGNFLDFWKYGIAAGVTILLLFGLVLAGAPMVGQAVALAVLALLSLLLNYRSHALVCLIASAILLSHRFLATRVARGWRFAGIISLALLFGSVLPVVARAGLLGPALQRKEIEQATTGLPILLAGRTEVPESTTAILQRPLLGWGSAGNIPEQSYAQAEHLAVRMGYSPTFEFEDYWRLPVSDDSAMHSLLLGSWAEGGVLAALLPAWLLVACIGVVWSYSRFGVWAPLCVTVAVQGIWDLWFQPWAYNMVPVFVCVTLLFAAAHRAGRRTAPP